MNLINGNHYVVKLQDGKQVFAVYVETKKEKTFYIHLYFEGYGEYSFSDTVPVDEVEVIMELHTKWK